MPTVALAKSGCEMQDGMQDVGFELPGVGNSPSGAAF
jgi:hypothetical protein